MNVWNTTVVYKNVTDIKYADTAVLKAVHVICTNVDVEP